MKALIVEDDENKRIQLESFIRKAFPQSLISIAKSLQSGLRLILRERYDCVILDMTMPTYDISVEEDGRRPQAYAGREILRQLDRREIVLPVIVVTQFDRFGEGKESLTLSELDAQLRTQHPNTYVGSVYYNPALEGWKQELSKAIKNIISKTEVK